MNAKTKKLLLAYIKLNLQPMKIAPCKDSKCSISYFIDVDKLKTFIDGVE